MLSYDFPPVFLSLLLATFGLVIGSFGNVLIHRLPQDVPEERDVVKKPSHCPNCKAQIRWRHNVPLFGWLWLRGKCADCSWPIPFRYPLVELISGIIFAASPWLFPFGTLIWLKAVLCSYALLILFFTDLTEFILPDAIQFPMIALGLLFTLPQIFWPDHVTVVQAANWKLLSVNTFANGLQMAPAWNPLNTLPVTWVESAMGAALGYGLPWLFNAIYKLIRKTDGLGMGDFKMLAWLGAFWGWGPMLGILFGASFLATLLAVVLLAMGKAKWQSMLPLGCFLALATWPIISFGTSLWESYLNIAR